MGSALCRGPWLVARDPLFYDSELGKTDGLPSVQPQVTSASRLDLIKNNDGGVKYQQPRQEAAGCWMRGFYLSPFLFLFFGTKKDSPASAAAKLNCKKKKKIMIIIKIKQHLSMHFFIKRKKDPEQKYDWSCVRLRNNQSWHILKAEFRSSNRCTQTIVFLVYF